MIPSKFRKLQTDFSMDTSDTSRDFDIPSVIIALAHAGRDETEAKANVLYKRSNEIIKLSPYEKVRTDSERWGMDYLFNLPKGRFGLLHVMVPSLQRAGELAYRRKALHEATVTVLALRRWRLEKGKYPESLSELVAGGYLKALPQDPYSDGPLVYRREGDDFILYSVSGNFADDGGVQDPDHDWETRKGKFLDRVFWPVEKAAE